MFSRSFQLFRIAGIPIRLDPSWFVIAALITWSLAQGYFPHYYEGLSEQTRWLMGVGGAIGLFGSILLHELSHALVALRFEIEIRGITLFIFGGVAEMEDEPPRPAAEFWVAIAGPIMSVLIAAACYGVYRAGVAFDLPIWVEAEFGYLALINTILVVFNAIPAFPLDGGRILRSALWAWKGSLRQATHVTSELGKGFGALLIALGVFAVFTGNLIGGIWYAIIGLFLRNAANMAYRQLMVRRYLEGEPVRKFMTADPIAVSPELSVEDLVEEYIYKTHHKLYPVVQDDKVVGCVSTREVKSIPRETWKDRTVADIQVDCTDERTIAPDTDAMEALSRMSQTQNSRFIVMEEKKLAGILTLKDLLDFLSMKVELETDEDIPDLEFEE